MDNSRFYGLVAGLFVLSFIGVFGAAKGFSFFKPDPQAQARAQAEQARHAEADKKHNDLERARDTMGKAMAALRDKPCEGDKLKNLALAVSDFQTAYLAKANCSSAANCDSATLSTMAQDSARALLSSGFAMAGYMQAIHASLPDDDAMTRPRNAGPSKTSCDVAGAMRGVVPR